jgi:hypothetical protein
VRDRAANGDTERFERGLKRDRNSKRCRGPIAASIKVQFASIPETIEQLKRAGFVDIKLTDAGVKYLEGYKRAIGLAESGEGSPFGVHILLGATALEKVRHAARTIEEGRTHPIQVVCQRPA